MKFFPGREFVGIDAGGGGARREEHFEQMHRVWIRSEERRVDHVDGLTEKIAIMMKKNKNSLDELTQETLQRLWERREHDGIVVCGRGGVAAGGGYLMPQTDIAFERRLEFT